MSTNGFSSEDDSRSGHDQVCCLLDNAEKCLRQAGNASYSKRIQKAVAQRKLKLSRDDSVSHIYICDFHKTMIQSGRTKRKRKDSEEDRGSPDADDDMIEVDFSQVPVNTLRRYKRHYKLQTRTGTSKTQLAELINKHFKTIEVSEKECVSLFIFKAKKLKNSTESKFMDNS